MLKTRKGSIVESAKKEVLRDNEFKGFYVKLSSEQYWKLQKHLNDLRVTKLEWLSKIVKNID